MSLLKGHQIIIIVCISIQFFIVSFSSVQEIHAKETKQFQSLLNFENNERPG